MKALNLFIISFVFATTSCAQEVGDWQLNYQNGETFKSSELKGQATVLHFWATWCPYCKKVQPGLEKLHAAHSNIRLIGISFREDEGVNPQQELKQRGHKFTTLIKGKAVAKKYGVKGTPTTIFLDSQGKEVHRTSSSNPNDPDLLKGFKAIAQQ